MLKEKKHLYEFGSFRVDPDRSVLLRGSDPVPLTAKAFETLLVLIRHNQETVSKDDLLKTVWPDTFVEEANLTQHISMLRKALGETPQDRRYILTVPGRGYRFVASVREVDKAEVEEGVEDALIVESHTQSQVTVEAEEAKPDAATNATALVASAPRTATWWLALFSLMLLATVGTTLLVKQHRTDPTLSAKDSILLADFDNSTGEPVFDGALKEGLAAQLGQSPFLDVIGNDQVRDTLHFMGRSPDERVQLPLAREVCQRAGSKALIAGAVGRLGRSYVVALQALNCADAAGPPSPEKP